MKKRLFVVLSIVVFCITGQAQNDSLYIYRGGKVIVSYAVNTIDSITFTNHTASSATIWGYLKSLPNDYSIIRDSILKYNYKKFDPNKSTPIGVNQQGNVLYDSVFVDYNPIFDKADVNSTQNKFTLFLPDNNVINKCLSELQTMFLQMGKTFTKNDTIVAIKWIKEACLYNEIITDFRADTITSVYNRVWNNRIQGLDATHYITLSNGRIYHVTKIKVPNYVIINRIKSLVEYWEYQDENQRYPSANDLYTFRGLISNPAAYVADFTPKPTILPNYVLLKLTGNMNSEDEYSVEFPPLSRYLSAADGKYHVNMIQVPTGEYKLYMGFGATSHPYVYVYFNGLQIGNELQASLSVPWNYDRITETEYDLNPSTGTKKWDGLGGLVGVVTVTRDDGKSGMASFKIKVKWSRNTPLETSKIMKIYHWALKPTINNY